MSGSHRDAHKNLQLYILPAIFFLAIVLVNGYILLFQSPGENSTQASLYSGDATDLAQAETDKILSYEKVKGLAATVAPHTTITNIKLEKKSGQLVYAVSLEDGTELIFDAETGTKLSEAIPAKETPSEPLPAAFNPSIDFATAREIAHAQKPDGDIAKIELGQSDNRAIYSAHFHDGSILDIAASDGAIVGWRNSPASAPSPSEPVPTSDSQSAPPADESTGSTEDSPSNSETSEPTPSF